MKKIWALFFLFAVTSLWATEIPVAQPQKDGTGSVTFTVSGDFGKFINYNSAFTANFEELISGSPASSTISIQGCSKGGTCHAAADSYTGNTTANRPVTFDAPYAYWKITVTFSGGTNVSITVNVLNSTANNHQGGGGTDAFASLTSGTNTSAAMVVGSGASLAASGSGTIAATNGLPSGIVSSPGTLVATGIFQAGLHDTGGQWIDVTTAGVSTSNVTVNCAPVNGNTSMTCALPGDFKIGDTVTIQQGGSTPFGNGQDFFTTITAIPLSSCAPTCVFTVSPAPTNSPGSSLTMSHESSDKLMTLEDSLEADGAKHQIFFPCGTYNTRHQPLHRYSPKVSWISFSRDCVSLNGAGLFGTSAFWTGNFSQYMDPAAYTLTASLLTGSGNSLTILDSTSFWLDLRDSFASGDWNNRQTLTTELDFKTSALPSSGNKGGLISSCGIRDSVDGQHCAEQLYLSNTVGTTTLKGNVSVGKIANGTQAAITAYSITSNVVTFTAANSYSSGQQIQIRAFPTATFLNGQLLTIISTGLSGSQFEANFTHANGSNTENAVAIAVGTTIALNGVTTVTNNAVHHAAIVVDSTNSLVRLFLDGNQEATSACTGCFIDQRETEMVNLGPDGCHFPENAGCTYPAITGAYDGIRISNTARYTANFTAPTAKPTVDGNTLGLLNFNNQTGVFTVGQTGVTGNGNAVASVYFPFHRGDACGATQDTAILMGLNFTGGDGQYVVGGIVNNYLFDEFDTTHNGLLIGQCAWSDQFWGTVFGGTGRYGLASAQGLGTVQSPQFGGQAYPYIGEGNVTLQDAFWQISQGVKVAAVIKSANGGSSIPVVINPSMDFENADTVLETLMMLDENDGFDFIGGTILADQAVSLQAPLVVNARTGSTGEIHSTRFSYHAGQGALIHVAGTALNKPIGLYNVPTPQGGLNLPWSDRAASVAIHGTEWNTTDASIASVESGPTFVAPDGTASTPAYAFIGEKNTGFYRCGTSAICYAGNGGITEYHQNGEIELANTKGYQISNNNGPTGTPDVMSDRMGPAVIGSSSDGQTVDAGGSFSGASYIFTQHAALGHATTGTITSEAPASVTPYEVIWPGAAASGLRRWANASSVVTESVSELSGDATTSGSNTVTVVKVNGASIPASSFLVGTNSSNQLIAAQPFVANAQTTTYQVVAADFAGCKTIPVSSGTFTVTLVASGSQPASGQCINVVNYGSGVVTIARSGQNINGAAANLTLNAGSASAPTSANITSDGTNYVASVDEGTVGTVTSVATTSPITGGTFTTSGTIACATCVTSAAALTSTAIVTGGGSQASQTPSATATLNSSGNMSLPGTLSVTGHDTFEGVTSTGATGTNLLVFGTSPTLTTPNVTTIKDANANPFILSSATASAVDSITVTNAATANPATVTVAGSGTDTNINTALNAKGSGIVQSSTFFQSTTNRVTMTADWTCGTGGTVSSCTAATIVGSTGTPLTLTLPNQALSWHWQCDLVVSTATGTPANNWNMLTATNGATNVTVSYMQGDSATTFGGGATTDQASTTTTFAIGGAWTLGATATKVPVHISGSIEGASASGTVVSLQLVDPTVADLLTVYRGATCSVSTF